MFLRVLFEWKALVENCSDKKLKTLHTDNGGEYVSFEFDDYLKSEGIRHESTIKKHQSKMVLLSA